MTSIPLNSPSVPDLSQIAAKPPMVSVGIQWQDGSTTKFEVEDIQKFSDEDFRLFMLCLLAANVNDPRFVATFKPTADDDEPTVGDEPSEDA